MSIFLARSFDCRSPILEWFHKSEPSNTHAHQYPFKSIRKSYDIGKVLYGEGCSAYHHNEGYRSLNGWNAEGNDVDRGSYTSFIITYARYLCSRNTVSWLIMALGGRRSACLKHKWRHSSVTVSKQRLALGLFYLGTLSLRSRFFCYLPVCDYSGLLIPAACYSPSSYKDMSDVPIISRHNILLKKPSQRIAIFPRCHS